MTEGFLLKFHSTSMEVVCTCAFLLSNVFLWLLPYRKCNHDLPWPSPEQPHFESNVSPPFKRHAFLSAAHFNNHIFHIKLKVLLFWHCLKRAEQLYRWCLGGSYQFLCKNRPNLFVVSWNVAVQELLKPGSWEGGVNWVPLTYLPINKINMFLTSN